MKLYLLNDKTAILFGADARYLESEVSGVLSIGLTKVNITAGKNSMPKLSNGAYEVYFTTEHKETYKIGVHTACNGFLAQTQKYTKNEIALLLRIEALERLCADIAEKTNHLVERFDTNSLNFLFNTEEDT